MCQLDKYYSSFSVRFSAARLLLAAIAGMYSETALFLRRKWFCKPILIV